MKPSSARTEELSLLFTEARTHNVWSDQPVDDDILRRLYDLARMGPTGGNSQPLRVVFVKDHAAKEKLRPALAPMNVDKVMSAPVTAIVAYDTAFYDKMPKLFPARPAMRETMISMGRDMTDRMALQSATLQAGYLIVAARALGLDCGPIGGFDAAKIDAAFFPDSSWRSTLLVNLGHGMPDKLFPRLPRLEFDEACRIE